MAMGVALLVSADPVAIQQLGHALQELSITPDVCREVPAAVGLLNRRKFEAVMVYPNRLAIVKITRLGDVEKRTDRRSVAVGTFDGVHLGHRKVIEGSDSVLTFDPHPVSVVAPQHTPKLLTPPGRKAELIEALGVREMIVIPFDADFASRTAGEFVDDVLVGALGATRVAIGENFRFGHKAQGDPRLLAADERFATVVHPLLEVDGEIVSSSHIRGLVLAGEGADRKSTRL